MEDLVEAVILGGANEENIEHVILQHLLMDRDNVNPLVNNNFNLNELSDDDIKLNFRFQRNHLERLVQVLGLPDEIRTDTRNKVSVKFLLKKIKTYFLLCPNFLGLTALCRLTDMCYLFGLSPQSLSQIINKTIELILENHASLLSDLNALHWLNREKLQYYAQVTKRGNFKTCENKGGAVPNCWGFIDGTARPICRPTVNQQDYYSGHKRFHCLKYQSVLCPDGIIASLKGAFIRRRHDAGIFRESQLYEELEQVAVINQNEKYTLYGDQAYGVMELLLSPYPGRPENLTPQQYQFNMAMKVLRVSVEWGFQKIVTEFAFVDFKKNQKILLQDIDSMFKVAVLLTNCHTCLYGSQAATYFNTRPPTLEEYFGV